MSLTPLLERNPVLKDLMRQAAYWRTLDARVKTLLPANLHAHFQVACIDEDGTLVLWVGHNMAASRLRMIVPVQLAQMQQLDERIRNVRIKIQPPQNRPAPAKQAKLSDTARNSCRETAAQLAHHPKLAAALEKLAKVADR
ncbi:hypothetical protein L1281_000480 [Neisseria sp. HSC-16F19]|nr:DciA family protein [Neisseria sp. HSC-16F19]MCP2039901.1 hypothetical protein [Neisseria sp. HSC-16F19]